MATANSSQINGLPEDFFDAKLIREKYGKGSDI
jgi:hypothetical protein